MLESLRTALLITLAILVVVILVRRVKQYMRQHHLPIPQQVKLVEMQVEYHPLRLRVVVKVPVAGTGVQFAVLSQERARLKQWPSTEVPQGEQVVELPLEAGQPGVFFLEVATDTQRTERRFTVRQA